MEETDSSNNSNNSDKDIDVVNIKEESPKGLQKHHNDVLTTDLNIIGNSKIIRKIKSKVCAWY